MSDFRKECIYRARLQLKMSLVLANFALDQRRIYSGPFSVMPNGTTIDVLAAGHLRLVVEAIDRHIHVLFCLPCVHTTRFEHGASFAIVCYGNVST